MIVFSRAERRVGPRPPQRGGRRLQRRLNSHSGRSTQQDPIGIAGGAHVYGFVSGDPVNHADPFGLYVVLKGSPQFQRDVRSAYEADAEFRSDYDIAHGDTTATFVIAETPYASGARGGGIGPWGDDAVAPYRKMWGIPNLRGIAWVSTHPSADSVRCGARHEMVHLRGLLNGGTEQLQEGAHEEFKAINAGGCPGAHEHAPRIRR